MYIKNTKTHKKHEGLFFSYKNNFWEHKNALNDSIRVRQRLADLRVICALLPATWSHANSSEPVTNGRNNGIVMGEYKKV